MPSCVACGAELEPPVRAPHTVYVKTLYRIGGQDYCRHHIIRAAVAAGVIAEVKPGAGPVSSSSAPMADRRLGLWGCKLVAEKGSPAEAG